MRKRVNNVSAVGIIHKASDPSQVFLEIKDAGYPVKVFRHHFCFIGGNWIGDGGARDLTPHDTFVRELNEEMSFEKGIKNTLELKELGVVEEGENYELAPSLVEPTQSDRAMLSQFVRVAQAKAVHFKDFVQYVPKEVFRDPKRGESWGLSSYFSVPLSDDIWECLGYLQHRFGNLSNESITVMTSLDEIKASGLKGIYGHDQVLRNFFACQGLDTDGYPIVEGPVVWAAAPCSNYEEYLRIYEIAKTPFTT